MRHKNIALLLFSFILGILSCSTIFAQKQTIIYIVRHAEKNVTNIADTDPELNEDGLKRANILALKFKSIPLDAIFTTNTKRTFSTIKNIVESKNLVPIYYKGNDLEELAHEIKTKFKGKKILIVGHSNTILETIEALGMPRPIQEIKDNEFNNLFKLNINSDGSIEVFGEHYGAKNPVIPTRNIMK